MLAAWTSGAAVLGPNDRPQSATRHFAGPGPAISPAQPSNVQQGAGFLLVTSGRGEEQQADGRDCPRTNIWGIHLGRAAALSQFLALAGVCDLAGVKVLVGAKSVPVPVMVN